MKQLCVVALVVVLLAAVVPTVFSSAWNSRNDPTTFNSFYSNGPVYSLKSLPTSGTLQTTPWADTYWPSYQSGIAIRWASRTPNNFNYTLYTKQQLQAMSPRELVQLSPAEKYDIFVGRYDYPTVRAEWQRTSPADASWEGICHGWAVAALQYQQPNPVTLENPDGIDVPFASSDVKAYLDYFIAEYAGQYASTDFIGDRCNYDIEEYPAKGNISACADLNAGAFHVLISNMLSKNVLAGFVGDRDRSLQVWNQPIFKFTSDLTGRTRPPHSKAAPGTQTEVYVDTTLYYTLEMRPQYQPISSPVVGNLRLQYWLELDAQGNILGGSYDTWERLDFAWMQSQVLPFSGFFKNVQTIYQAATNGSSNNVVANMVDLKPLPTTVLSEIKGQISVSSYENDVALRWSITPPAGMKFSAVEFEFDEFATERYRDKVKIYEGADGNGAMVGVFHGSRAQVPSKPFVVNSNGAVVVFHSDHWGTDAGFVLRYRGIF